MTYSELHSIITHDLDENILCDKTIDAQGITETHITFTNPVTDRVGKIVIEQYPNNETTIFYVENFKIGEFEEHMFIHDLKDLYDMILIDDKDGQ